MGMEKIKKISGTKKRLFAGSSLSLFCSYTMKKAQGSHFFSKIFDNHQHVLVALTVTAAASSLFYYLYTQTTQARSSRAIEMVRKNGISKRKLLQKPQEKYASLKIEKRFVNPFEEWTEIPFYKTLLFWLGRWKGNGIPQSIKELEVALPVVQPNLEKIKNGSDSVTFTWFGQSTCLMTIDGLTILSDPVFSKCSVNDYFGPKRLRPIPCQLEEFIDTIDIVIVSHDHFDHLDEAAVQKLGNSVVWYIPLGLKGWFVKRGISNVIEMDWWQELQHQQRPDIQIACVPAMHWSGSRTPFEKNNTLWCSYVIKGKNDKIFFCGDTGYAPELFKAIGDLYAPFTLAAIPIGSFLPTQLMQHLHMGPEDAVKVHFDLGSPRLSIGIHWATFMMSDEHYLAPREVLNQIWNDCRPNHETHFTTTAFGQTIVLD
ncbi:beta-lactamase superfamily domain-containing protein [Gilbertella persicaria]|uniref:beta-lactamase superfamily domain-containing protein n=1 Tax=Gilbertella persicaria TaxID=101096 RepID=UPI0022200CBD|nr:beta-lactamase superfamily domain-containing protein [Gilbertella persicaria]KAI8077963.1 beta-lactamase superfamily domain-containing protein [Gilbertella persicaria]